MSVLKGSVIVVTGAGSGIGQGCVELLCDNGAMVVGLDVQESGTQTERFKHFMVDVRDEVSVNNTLDIIDSQYSKIDALVNCAGVYSCGKPFYEMSLEEWNKVLSINLTGTFLMSKCVGQRMIKNEKGKIVNISCIRSRIFRPNMAEYAAAKGGSRSINFCNGARPSPL
ncbi:SDR family oxidoreductase [Sporomusa sp.]|uniref:SDR family NAD(P)-dependent oxidoreductase n=1 Tax=Sporomusa sp. TaxID=2078658 RepID=UPI002B5B28DE|nr:SDR family oxidoreductase [Sporomusa sp.]HWR41999.1 SDR family oxidoreductase [Sporomusa sp.]